MLKLFLLIFFLASLLFFRFVTFYQSQPVYKAGDEVILITKIHEEPDLSNKGQKFSIKTTTNQIIFVTVGATPRLHFGDHIQVSGLIQERLIDNNCNEECRKLLVLSYPNVILKEKVDDPVVKTALFVRKQSKELFEKTLPPTSASLMSGIVFGAKEHFQEKFKENLSSTGVLHVIAASGMNVTFVASSLLYIFSLFMKRQLALLAGCAGIVFYVFLVGFEPSIVRAAIMGILVFGAGILGRQHWALFGIGLAGYGMLAFQPSYLFDVGFQLSFMATLGILLVKPVTDWVASNAIVSVAVMSNAASYQKYIFKLFGESVVTTFAAQIATLPILLGIFGSVGALSLLVNALVLWIVPIVMTIGSIAVLIGLLFPVLAQAILYCSLPFLLFFETVVSFFGALEWNVEVEHFSLPMAIGYYLVIAAILLEIKNRKTKSKHP